MLVGESQRRLELPSSQIGVLQSVGQRDLGGEPKGPAPAAVLLADRRQGQRAIHTLLRLIESAGQQVRLAQHCDPQGRVQPTVDARGRLQERHRLGIPPGQGVGVPEIRLDRVQDHVELPFLTEPQAPLQEGDGLGQIAAPQMHEAQPF